MELVITYYNDQSQKIYYASQMISNNSNPQDSDLAQYDITIVHQTTVGNDPQQLLSNNIINSQTMKELNDLFDTHFSVLIDDLSNAFVDGITNLVDTQSSLFIIILIIFLILVVVVYILFYFKLVNYMGNKVIFSI